MLALLNSGGAEQSIIWIIVIVALLVSTAAY